MVIGKGFLFLALVVAMIDPALAQSFSVRPIPSSTPNLGNIAASASGTTIFRIATGGSVTVVGGSGGNILSGTKSAATVTIRCSGGGGVCVGATAMVKIWPRATVTGRGQQVQNITVASGTGTVGLVTVNPDGSIQFPLTGFSGTGGRTFKVGLDLPVLGDTASTATTATAVWAVGVAKAPTIPTSSSRNGRATATVRRALVLGKLSDLGFGAIIPPASGSSTVVIDGNTGARSIGSGSPILLGGVTSGRAEYLAGGGTGSAFSIGLPASLVMVRAGGGTLNATLNPTASGAQTLNGAGTFSFGVGGTLTVPNGTTGGDYSGSFVVTIDYN